MEKCPFPRTYIKNALKGVHENADELNRRDSLIIVVMGDFFISLFAQNVQ